ncbi:glycosyltransferase [Chryseobacterium geocarposphaerae]|uniref:Glycosyl transferase family 2 n=1 Tax=Chryseobacterium geocarposphaerae TaxID=1416776 RepID=A0A2M9C1E0_9FLAO|nr:glycosyltransferase [Chryseobacterium geocarposphaerae]PJJ64255.1 glycosyl transferase family 2 [Chryseobacterium geocarposphaerae]
MISIIVSSYQENDFSRFSKSVHETIGIPDFEIIKVWNPNLMSITEAYNLGAEKSKYEILLFIHEDIVFHTENWGEKLIHHLNNPEVGVIGVAGSSYVPVAPSSWTVSKEYNVVNILQSDKKNPIIEHLQSVHQQMTKVYTIDGVFMAITKKNFNTIKFNEEINGFHGYDLDFSLRTAKTFQNYIVNDILVQHFSKGNRDKKWLDANIKIKEKIGSNFPHQKNSETEKNIFLSFLYQYFIYYPVNSKNIFFTMKFFPFKHLTFQDKVLILKKYFNYIRFSSEINKKTQ